jgi:hypothetical protein
MTAGWLTSLLGDFHPRSFFRWRKYLSDGWAGEQQAADRDGNRQFL